MSEPRLIAPKLWLKNGAEASIEDCRDYSLNGVQERDTPPIIAVVTLFRELKDSLFFPFGRNADGA